MNKRAMEKAQRWVTREGLVYVWQVDEDCGPEDFEFENDKAFVREYGAVGCRLVRVCPQCVDAMRLEPEDCRHAETLASLWGITESLNNRERDAYRRVVEAELALEVMP